MKYKVLKEAALRELMNEDTQLNEWSSDVEMPYLHAEWDKYNARRSEVPADSDETEKDPFFNWSPDGIKNHNIDNVYATDNQQKQFDDNEFGVNEKFDKIKAEIKRVFFKGAHIMLSDKRLKELFSGPTDYYGTEFSRRFKEKMGDDLHSVYDYMSQVFGEYTDEINMEWWILETYAQYHDGDEQAFEKAWKELSSYIERAREDNLRASKNKLRKSFGW